MQWSGGFLPSVLNMVEGRGGRLGKKVGKE